MQIFNLIVLLTCIRDDSSAMFAVHHLHAYVCVGEN